MYTLFLNLHNIYNIRNIIIKKPSDKQMVFEALNKLATEELNPIAGIVCCYRLKVANTHFCVIRV